MILIHLPIINYKIRPYNNFLFISFITINDHEHFKILNPKPFTIICEYNIALWVEKDLSTSVEHNGENLCLEIMFGDIRNKQ